MINEAFECGRCRTREQQAKITKPKLPNVVEAGESGVLCFSQVTANPSFSEAGDFAGETISSLATKVRAGDVPVDALKVGVVDGADGVRLIVNTRTSWRLEDQVYQKLPGM